MRRQKRSRLVRRLVLGLALAAIVVPSAQARTIAPEGNVTASTPARGVAQVRASVSRSGFDWRAVGVLGGVAVALSIMLGAALLVRNRARLANG